MSTPIPQIPQPRSVPVVVRVPAAVDALVVELFERRSEIFSHLSLEEFYGQIIATHESIRCQFAPHFLSHVPPKDITL